MSFSFARSSSYKLMLCLSAICSPFIMLTANADVSTISVDSGEPLTWTADGGDDEGRSVHRGGDTNLGAIKAKIMGHFQVPYNIRGQSTTLTIRVSARGNVLSVSASGGSQALQDAATSAVRRASPLPIDANDPTVYPSFTMRFIAR